ncbi:MAG: alpha/beta fold hydrolase [Chloroflexota bacterium]|nr:alpha/beta fold hydrolase [Chloroflexota bacterium]
MKDAEEREVSFLSQGQRVAGTLHLPPGATPFGGRATRCIITCHGYISHRNSDKWLAVARRLSEAGLAVLRFDFRGCGESEGNPETASGRVADLGAALDFVGRELRPRKLGLLGSSLGGAVALLALHQPGEGLVAAHDPTRIDCLVTWATPSEVRLFPHEYPPAAVLEAAWNIRCPILIVHGTQDEVVDPSHAQRLFESAPEPKRLEFIAGGDHTFTNPRHRKRVVELSVGWFERYLVTGPAGNESR